MGLDCHEKAPMRARGPRVGVKVPKRIYALCILCKLKQKVNGLSHF